VVLAICAALEQPARAAGQTFELAGPEVLTMLELNRRVATASARKPLLLEMPDALSAMFATLTGWLPGAQLSRAQWKLLKAGNVASGALPGLAELGVQPRPLVLFLDRWMQRFREHGRFGAKA
jgi:NADH dehydrogenase